MLAAAVLPVDQSTAGNETRLRGAVGDVCAHAPHFGRLMPTGNSTDNNSDVAWLVILSDWLDWPHQDLSRRIAEILRRREEVATVPIILVVDDLGRSGADHEASLSDLTQAGATILVPHSQEEVDTIKADPVAFAASRAAFVTPLHSAGAATRSLSHPTSPDGFKEFAKAVTRLSPTDLREVIEGQRADDWRYST